MGRKCPPGVICIENISILFFILILVSISYLFYIQNKSISSKPIIIKEKDYTVPQIIPQVPLFSYPNYQDDVLINPYSAPLRNDNIFPNIKWNVPTVPINIPTQGFDSTYRQIGILTRLSGSEKILPLMGRPTIVNRDKWNFYTMTDKNNMIKLPVSNRGRSCTTEYGCDNIYNGDTVYVEGYNDAFKATIYDNDTMKYIPYL